MDLMGIRRGLMMGGKKLIDTSPIIDRYGVTNPSGNPLTKPYFDNENGCVTVRYYYPPMATKQTMTLFCGSGNVSIYNDERYMDYWGWTSLDSPITRTVINANSTNMSISLDIRYLDKCYAYLEETGQILFAGKDSPYYGYTNINDIP